MSNSDRHSGITRNLTTGGLSLVALLVGSACSAGGGSAPSQGSGGSTYGYGTGGAGALPGTGGAGATGATGGGTGAGATGGAPAGNGCGANGAFACMAPPMLEPVALGAPGQWTYHEIAGATCRDGSPAGFYTRASSTSKKLLIYLEQGGACFNSALCAFNPVSVDDSITGRTLSEALSGMHVGVRQVPQTTGIFDDTKAENPYRDWNQVWIPYCTGDAFGGSHPDATIPGVDGPQQFVGYMNMQKFIGHIVPTFHDAERVVLTGTSAGSFGAGMNFNQTQDAFGSVPVTLIMDSGIPFSDGFMSPCLQQMWRDYWNLGPAIPPDCAECNGPGGGGILNLVTYSARKYPGVKLGIISASEDDLMRFFFAFGENDCKGASSYPDGKYTQALMDLRQIAAPYRAQSASYFVPGIKHMYSQFDDFYQPMAGGVPMVSWVNDVLAGNMHDVGP